MRIEVSDYIYIFTTPIDYWVVDSQGGSWVANHPTKGTIKSKWFHSLLKKIR